MSKNDSSYLMLYPIGFMEIIMGIWGFGSIDPFIGFLVVLSGIATLGIAVSRGRDDSAKEKLRRQNEKHSSTKSRPYRLDRGSKRGSKRFDLPKSETRLKYEEIFEKKENIFEEEVIAPLKTEEKKGKLVQFTTWKIICQECGKEYPKDTINERCLDCNSLL